MCLLNGDVGGFIPSSVDFGVENFYDLENGITTEVKIPIKKIIREMLHTYASEAYHNIIINDLDDKGLELLEYRGSTPMFLLTRDGETYTAMRFDENEECRAIIKGETKDIAISKIEENGGRIDGIYVCTAVEDDDRRKPNTGMAMDIKAENPHIDFIKTIVVGDSVTDKIFADKIGAKFIGVE